LGNNRTPVIYTSEADPDLSGISRGVELIAQQKANQKKTKVLAEKKSKSKMLVKTKGKTHAKNKYNKKKILNTAEKSGYDRIRG